MDAAVGGFGEKEPGDAVDQEPDAAEQPGHHECAADQQWVHTQPMGNAGGHASHPAIVGTPDSHASDRGKEIVES
jgi:hypothetical protein